MIDLANKNLANQSAKLIHSRMENFKYPEQKYDVVISRMAIHYVENLDDLFQSVNKTMKMDARFIFSVQLPLTTASFKSKSDGERKEEWIVDDYFKQGLRKEPWIGKTIIKYHRTIEFYFSALSGAGFQIEHLKEGLPEHMNFAYKQEFERRQSIPIILIFSCKKKDN